MCFSISKQSFMCAQIIMSNRCEHYEDKYFARKMNDVDSRENMLNLKNKVMKSRKKEK